MWQKDSNKIVDFHFSTKFTVYSSIISFIYSLITNTYDFLTQWSNDSLQLIASSTIYISYHNRMLDILWK